MSSLSCRDLLTVYFCVVHQSNIFTPGTIWIIVFMRNPFIPHLMWPLVGICFGISIDYTTTTTTTIATATATAAATTTTSSSGNFTFQPDTWTIHI